MNRDNYIDRLSIDLKMPSVRLPEEAQGAADSIVDEHVLPAVESVLNELEWPAEVSIPQIEIDVGRVLLRDLRPMVEARLRRALESCLSGPRLPDGPFSSSVVDSLRAFAGTGRVPWGKADTPFDPSRYLLEVLEQDAGAVVAWVEACPEKELSGLLMAIPPDEVRHEKVRVFRDRILARLSRDFPDTASVLSARRASWRNALVGAAAMDEPGSVAESGPAVKYYRKVEAGVGGPAAPGVPSWRYVGIDRKDIPEGASVEWMDPFESPGPDAPEYIMGFSPPAEKEPGPAVKYYRKVEAGVGGPATPGVDLPAAPVPPSWRYVGIDLKDIPEGTSVEWMDPLESPGPDAPEYIMEFSPPAEKEPGPAVKYYRKVEAGVERPAAPVPPSWRYVGIDLKDIPEGASVEWMDPLESPGPDAPEYIMEFSPTAEKEPGPAVKYYRKVEAGVGGPATPGVERPAAPVPPSWRYVGIDLKDIPEGTSVEWMDSLESPGPDAPEYIMGFSPPAEKEPGPAVKYYRKVEAGVGGPAPPGVDLPAAPVPPSWRYVGIDRKDIPEGTPVEYRDSLESPGPDSPEFVMTAGPFRLDTVSLPPLSPEEGAVGPDGRTWPQATGREPDLWAVRDFESGWTPERIPVSDAGLVLVHPFMHFLMQNLELTRDGEFVSPLARVRGVHLLRDLTGSSEPHYSNNLILEKILCGLPPGYALPPEWEPDRREKEEVEALLKAVCEYWRPLSGSSVRALCDGFILRPGTVERFEDTWIVKVEGRTVDILLDELPWEISLVHLPWLDAPVSVEWQQG